MKCCICGCEITHPLIKNYLGNNPCPVTTDPNKRCCDKCNAEVVIPARILLYEKQRTGGKK